MSQKNPPNSVDRFDSDSKLKLEKAHDAIMHPDKFAELFCNAARTQIPIRDELSSQMLTLLKTDASARAEVMALMRQVFAEDWRGFMRAKGGKLVAILGAIALAALSALFGAWFTHLYK